MSLTAPGPWLQYFPGDEPACYRWSSTLAMATNMAAWGGTAQSEVHLAADRLAAHLGDDDEWFRYFSALGEELAQSAAKAYEASHPLTAADQYLRACVYLQLAERFVIPKNDATLATSRRALALFDEFATRTDAGRFERVDLQSDSGPIPARLVRPQHAPADPGPAVVFFGGLDITKELQYCLGVPELLRRGITVLIVDGPGTGEAVRLNDIHLRHDYEVAASPAYDLLAADPAVDASRIAVMAVSLGGYYASRAAAMDPRFAACVAWGAIFDYHALWKQRFDAAYRTALSIPGDHIGWILGTDSPEEALAALEPFKLADVAPQIRCPHLIVHGVDDQQVPVSEAHALYEASGSEQKTLRLVTDQEGGAQHTQIDHLPHGMTIIADWLVDHLA